MRLGIVMDPIHKIHVQKDTSLVLLDTAQKRGWEIFYMEQKDLFITSGIAKANMRQLKVQLDPNHWYDFGNNIIKPLHELDVILMRKDPPFNIEYIYTTYILEIAENKGTLAINKPQSLRDANEKTFTTLFPQCTPESLVTRDINTLHEFISKHKEIVLKPLDSMGGNSIFRASLHDPNYNVMMETLTDKGKRFIMSQRFVPEIKFGDKRIFLIDGEPVPYALARIPKPGDFRGNLAAGATGKIIELSERDRWICSQLAPTLKAKELIFAGIDVIGDYLSEINVTSPTGIREIQKETGIDISEMIMDSIEKRL